MDVLRCLRDVVRWAKRRRRSAAAGAAAAGAAAAGAAAVSGACDKGAGFEHPDFEDVYSYILMLECVIFVLAGFGPTTSRPLTSHAMAQWDLLCAEFKDARKGNGVPTPDSVESQWANSVADKGRARASSGWGGSGGGNSAGGSSGAGQAEASASALGREATGNVQRRRVFAEDREGRAVQGGGIQPGLHATSAASAEAESKRALSAEGGSGGQQGGGSCGSGSCGGHQSRKRQRGEGQGVSRSGQSIKRQRGEGQGVSHSGEGIKRESGEREEAPGAACPLAHLSGPAPTPAPAPALAPAPVTGVRRSRRGAREDEAHRALNSLNVRTAEDAHLDRDQSLFCRLPLLHPSMPHLLSCALNFTPSPLPKFLALCEARRFERGHAVEKIVCELIQDGLALRRGTSALFEDIANNKVQTDKVSPEDAKLLTKQKDAHQYYKSCCIVPWLRLIMFNVRKDDGGKWTPKKMMREFLQQFSAAYVNDSTFLDSLPNLWHARQAWFQLCHVSRSYQFASQLPRKFTVIITAVNDLDGFEGVSVDLEVVAAVGRQRVLKFRLGHVDGHEKHQPLYEERMKLFRKSDIFPKGIRVEVETLNEDAYGRIVVHAVRRIKEGKKWRLGKNMEGGTETTEVALGGELIARAVRAGYVMVSPLYCTRAELWEEQQNAITAALVRAHQRERPLGKQNLKQGLEEGCPNLWQWWPWSVGDLWVCPWHYKAALTQASNDTKKTRNNPTNEEQPRQVKDSSQFRGLLKNMTRGMLGYTGDAAPCPACGGPHCISSIATAARGFKKCVASISSGDFLGA